MNHRIMRLSFGGIFAVALISGTLAVLFIGATTDSMTSRNKPAVVQAASPSSTSKADGPKMEAQGAGKDNWDRLSSIAPIVSGLMIAAVGGWATLTVSRHQRASETSRTERELTVQRSSIIPPLIPYLGSDKEREKRAALLAIDAMGDPVLAAKLAEIYGGEGSASALSNIAARSSREVAVVAERSLDTLFHSLKVSIVRLIVNDLPTASGFVVAPGRVLTVAHALRAEDRVVLKLYTGEEIDATILARDGDADLALLETARQDLPALTIQASASSEKEIGALFNEDVTCIGYTGSSTEPEVRVGPVTAIGLQLADFPGDPMIETLLHTAGGFSGAPAVNSKGRVIGIVRLARMGGYSYLISADSMLKFLTRHQVTVNEAR
ncbi:S1 family peptidase [Streptomyces kaniharaensis]|nr:serine protease [Streptomyces kaniharaensis]